MKKVVSISLLGLAIVLCFGMANGVYADAYGTAGCGLGSIIFGDKPGLVQVLAATTNGTFGTQTFGITTGTSNCKDTGGGSASAKAFIVANREAVSKDISRGSGETIESLSKLAGCADSKDVGQSLQGNFSSIHPDSSVTDEVFSDNVIASLRSEDKLACMSIQ